METFIDYRLGTTERYYLDDEKRSDVFIPKEILGSVAFVCYKNSTEHYHFAGTAFFVQPDPQEPALTVTAKHVILEALARSSDRRIYLRVNRRDGRGAAYVGYQEDKWLFHDDALYPADVAVMHGLPNTRTFDIQSIPLDVAATQDHLDQIGLGGEVFTVGLFVRHAGTHRNQPIVRAGNIAMLPDERVKTAAFGDMDALLIESRSIGGLSGSPVYGYVTGFRPLPGSSPFSGRAYFLLGLIHGHFPLAAPQPGAPVEPEPDAAPADDAANMGIAVVVPAAKIVETIDGPRMRARRAEWKRRNEDGTLPVPD